MSKGPGGAAAGASVVECTHLSSDAAGACNWRTSALIIIAAVRQDGAARMLFGPAGSRKVRATRCDRWLAAWPRRSAAGR
jgi:hypothetical protein